MKRLAMIAVLFTGLSCGWFQASYVPALLDTMKAVAEIVERETGRSLDELPMECEHEYHPATPTAKARILILCDAELPGR